jgi:photosystem II stability/assembly factor-like uncharacterized protein
VPRTLPPGCAGGAFHDVHIDGTRGQGFLVGDGGVVCRTSDAGDTWARFDVPGAQADRAIRTVANFELESNRAVFAGDDATLWYYVDSSPPPPRFPSPVRPVNGCCG